MLKIGLVTPGWPGTATPNGIATSVRHLAYGLTSIGHRPVILALSEDGPAPVNIPVVTMPTASWTIRQKIRHWTGQKDITVEAQGERIAKAISDAVREHRIDVVIMEETQGWHGKPPPGRRP